MTRWLVVAVAVAVLVAGGLAACSSGDDEGGDAGVDLESTLPTGDPRTVDVLTQAILDDADDPNALPVDESSARCMAERLVQGFDPDRLEGLGLDVATGAGPDLYEPPLTSDEADAVFEIMDTCVGLVGALSDAFASDGTTPADVAACAAQRYYDSGLLREALFRSEPDEELNGRIDAALDDAFATC